MNVLLGGITVLVVGIACGVVLLLVGGAALVMGLNRRQRPSALTSAPPAPPVQPRIDHPTASEERAPTPAPGDGATDD